MKVVVDTSVWIDFFRRSDAASRVMLDSLLDDDAALLAVPVRIELLAGARTTERARLARVLDALPLLVPIRSTWEAVERWAVSGAEGGERFGVGDLLIAALAAEQGAPVWSLDHDFARMAALGFVELYPTR